MVSVRNQVEDCELLSFSHFIQRQRCKLCSFVATNFPFRFLIHILLRQIPDSHSIAEDTFWCRFLIHILLQKIPCLSSESEDSPLHLTGSLGSTKSQSNRSRR